MNLNQINVLIPSGSGAPGFAGIAACLREDSRIFLVSGDIQNEPYGKTLSDAFYAVPEAKDEVAYIAKILEICLKESIHVVLPITTRELEIIAKHQILFSEKNIVVMISSEKNLQIANNKGKLWEFAQNVSISVPEGGVVENISDFEKLASNLFKNHDELFFKPVTGNGSRGIGRITQKIEPNGLMLKPDLIPLTIEEWLIRLDNEFSIPLLLTEYLPGKEYSVDTFFWEGMEPIIIPRTRDKMVSGISVSGRFEKHPLIIESTKKLIELLDLKGPIGIQWKLDAQGIPKLLEINPRLQGTTSVLRQLGINIPLIAVKKALNLPLEILGEIAWGKSFTRHWQDVFLQN